MENSGNLDKIISEIEKQSEIEIEKINKETQEEINNYKKEFEEKKNNFIQKQNEVFKISGERLKRQLITETRMKLKNELLNYKRRLIEEVLGETAEELMKLTGTSRRKLMEILLKEVVDIKTEEIQPSFNEVVLDENFVKEINNKNNWNLLLGEKNKQINEGFLLKGKDFETVVDFDGIKEFLREKEEMKVSKYFFSESNVG